MSSVRRGCPEHFLSLRPSGAGIALSFYLLSFFLIDKESSIISGAVFIDLFGVPVFGSHQCGAVVVFIVKTGAVRVGLAVALCRSQGCCLFYSIFPDVVHAYQKGTTSP